VHSGNQVDGNVSPQGPHTHTPCRSAGSSVCAGLKTGYDHLASEPTHREQVAFLKFGSLEGRRGLGMGAECSSCPALLLGLDTGFQIWTLGDSVKEVVSRRDGPARSLLPPPPSLPPPLTPPPPPRAPPFLLCLASHISLQSNGWSSSKEVLPCSAWDPPFTHEHSQGSFERWT